MKRKKSALKNIVGTVVHNKRKIPNREKAKERERERERERKGQMLEHIS